MWTARGIWAWPANWQMIPPAEFLQAFIRPVLARLSEADPRLGSRAAEQLLLGTALAESGLAHLWQLKGPALGFFQIEPATAEDVYVRYLLQKRTDLLGAVRTFQYSTPYFDQLACNPCFGAALARIKFWMAKPPLPEAEDIDGLGAYWKAHYNTPAGKGTAAQWALNYRRHVA